MNSIVVKYRSKTSWKSLARYARVAMTFIASLPPRHPKFVHPNEVVKHVLAYDIRFLDSSGQPFIVPWEYGFNRVPVSLFNMEELFLTFVVNATTNRNLSDMIQPGHLLQQLDLCRFRHRDAHARLQSDRHLHGGEFSTIGRYRMAGSVWDSQAQTSK
jgi:hypothetical protein